MAAVPARPQPYPDSGVELSWPQVLAWRLRRQLVEPRGRRAPAAVAAAIAGVQAQVASSAELAVGVRRRRPRPGDVDRALWRDRSLVRTWAMRGTLHLLPADEAPSYVAALSTVRPWRQKAWERSFGVTATEVERITAAIGEALEGRALTREQLAEEVVRRAKAAGHAERLASGWAELLKPAAFQGLLCHAPPDGARVRFTRPDTWVEGWRAVEPDEGGSHVVRAFLRGHGPATIDAFARWFARLRPTHVRPWFERIADELVSVSIEGRPALALADDLPSLRRQAPTDVVRLLPGFDQYVLAAERENEAVLPRPLKAEVSRTAGWISPVVVAGGRIVGVWELDRDAGRITARLAARVPKAALEAEAAHVASAVGIPTPTVVTDRIGR
jgi:hypothetical protein